MQQPNTTKEYVPTQHDEAEEEEYDTTQHEEGLEEGYDPT